MSLLQVQASILRTGRRMGFSESRFQDIVKCLGSTAHEARSGSEKRRSGRIELRSKVAITVSSPQSQQTKEIVELRDLSPRGMKFVRQTGMTRGEQFVFHAPKPGGTPSPVLCSVAHCRRGGGLTEWVIGAEFMCRMDTTAKGEAADAEAERIKRSILD